MSRLEMTNNCSILSGKVTKQSLPLLPVPPPPDSPNLKRLDLRQGELAQFWNEPEAMRYMAYVKLLPGTIRGNHFHRFKKEWVYLIEGEALLLVQDIQTGEQSSLFLRAGDLVFIPTGIAHAFHCRSAGHAVEFSPVLFDSTDSYAFPLQIQDSGASVTLTES